MNKNSHFTGGGLEIEDLSQELALEVPEGAILPPYIDSKPFCIPASDQGNHPYCAAAAWVGYIEVHNYRKTHRYEQIPFKPVYDRAKERDGNNHHGTTLTSAYLACVDLGLIELFPFEVITTREQLHYGLLTHDVVVVGYQITDKWNHVDSETGWIEKGKGVDLGGHAVLSCYYDLLCDGWQNSWGNWGCAGNGRMDVEQFKDQFIYGVVLKCE